LKGRTMKITECGRAAVNHPQVRLMLLDVAFTQLFVHKLSKPELEWLLGFTVATYLAAVPIKKGVGFRHALGDPDPAKNEIDGHEEFMVEHADIIQPIIQDTIAGAEGAYSKAMGL